MKRSTISLTERTTMRKYCDQYLTGRHIWTSIHHPQTMGKIANAQKGLKRLLIHRLGKSSSGTLNSYVNKWMLPSCKLVVLVLIVCFLL
ncbi:MAG: hypothetical protein L0H53_12510 [Candidatus Nitrosocosmicus sp.]|nr:hypothetical protein [Candidatus Nitrosocosmicus sp.]MDN5868250.1 hypothetical protein [Candidatus Nitrosocosmicus sp.]